MPCDQLEIYQESQWFGSKVSLINPVLVLEWCDKPLTITMGNLSLSSIVNHDDEPDYIEFITYYMTDIQ